MQAGRCQLSLNFHIFSFPCLSHSVLALQLFMNNCRLLETWVCQSNSPSWQHGVLIVHAEIACRQPLLLNAGSAWDTQLFLYIRITREIGIAFAQQKLQRQLPTFPYLFKHSRDYSERSSQNSVDTSAISLITQHHLFLCIFNQVTSSTPLLFCRHCCLSSLLDFFAFRQPLLPNRLMWSISPLSFLHSLISNLHCSAQVWWDSFPCYCSALYYWVCDLACC